MGVDVTRDGCTVNERIRDGKGKGDWVGEKFNSIDDDIVAVVVCSILSLLSIGGEREEEVFWVVVVVEVGSVIDRFCDGNT